MLNFRNRFRTLAIVLGLMTLASPALADTNLQGYPSQWRLQDYLDGNITLWFTGSSCGNGNLIMLASAPAESRARLWSLLLTTRAMGRQIGIFYNSSCQITDFYAPENQ